MHRELSVAQPSNKLVSGFVNIRHNQLLKLLHWIVGLPIHAIVFLLFIVKRRKTNSHALYKKKYMELKHSSLFDELTDRYEQQYRKKQQYFNKPVKKREEIKFVEQQVERQLKRLTEEELAKEGTSKLTYIDYFQSLLLSRSFVILTFIPGLILYSLCLIYENVFFRFIFERIVLTIFVIFSVIVIVFSILYFSPTDSAANILGESATIEQREEFNRQYGLDQPYHVQLANAIKGFVTFDLGHSFTGNEVISKSIANRFPVTMTLAFFALVLAVVVAIPIGMISAAKMNSFWDYSFMFLALVALSIPSFWLGLIMILIFAINGNLLPATYSPSNWLSLIMPVIVLSTGLAAAIARMTRSSMLEVMHEDYMVTAKAKGLSARTVFFHHGLRNAWIPILTVIGLQFGAMLGGAAVTEQVFNISGLGSYIVDKQFIPDIPAILAGVVYIAVSISLVNLVVDLLYALLNPRIRAQLKQGS